MTRFSCLTVLVVLCNLGIEQNAAAVYHAGLGRWVQRDPLGYVDGANMVEYGADNPAARVAPSGMSPPTYPPPPPNDILPPPDRNSSPCQRDVHTNCWADSYWGPRLKAIRAEIYSACGGRMPTYTCRRRCPVAGHAGDTMPYCSRLGRGMYIVICEQSGNYCAALLHELTHARQLCEHGLYDGDCRSLQRWLDSPSSCIDYEMEAYMNAGQCPAPEDCCERVCDSCYERFGGTKAGRLNCIGQCLQKYFLGVQHGISTIAPSANCSADSSGSPCGNNAPMWMSAHGVRHSLGLRTDSPP